MHYANGVEALRDLVSMKSGQEGRNNVVGWQVIEQVIEGVSMKSGLEGRNNPTNSESVIRELLSQ